MPVFYSLQDIANIHPRHVGEMARLLHQLQQAGQTIPSSWVIPNEYFQQALQKLTAREPVFADWPQLLWQTPNVHGYAGQQIAQRLSYPLSGYALNVSLEPCLATLKTPVVRLIPSLWLGEGHPSAEFAELIGAQFCWAETGAIETTIKQLWGQVLSARSLAYWQHWQHVMGAEPRSYPQHISVAVIIQAVEPANLSGTLTIRSNSITIQAIQGLSYAIAESYPDTYQGQLPHRPPFLWQQGYQEYCYQPTDTDPSFGQLGDYLTPKPTSQTASDIISPDTEINLLAVAKALQAWSVNPLKVEWVLPASHTDSLQITQALRWPLDPTPRTLPVVLPSSFHHFSGSPASPGQAVGEAFVIKPGDPLPASAHQQIIVASEVAPHWLPLLKTAAAIVSETGGLTCHAAILARELRLPAVVGVAEATQHLHTGDTLQLDGDRGLIEILALPPAKVTPPPPLPDIPDLDSQTKIWLNLSQPDVAEAMATLPVAGVGLLRSEWLMMAILENQHPYQWVKSEREQELIEHLANQLRPILSAFFPRPVRYRSLDIRSNEFAQLQGAPLLEPNPMLGVRGTFSYQQHPEFFRLELAVLKQLQSEGYTNLQLLLPFVRTVEEVQFCQQLIHEVGLDQSETFELWIMAEVPSVLFLMPQYAAAGVQGIAIGTNDLTQLLLGIDRDQAIFADYFDALHPAVQAALSHLIQQAQIHQIPCTLCGVAASHHANFVTFLVQQGIDSVSVDAAATAATVKAIQQAEASLGEAEN